MTLAILFESVGAGEWLVLLAVVLVVVGPKRLPSTARKFGQYYAKFRRAAEGFKRQLLDMDSDFTNAIREAQDEVQKAADEVQKDLTPPDPSEYGGIEENYADYGDYDPAGTAESETASTEPQKDVKPAEAPAAKPVVAATPAPSSGIKITVSPLPQADAAKKAQA